MLQGSLAVFSSKQKGVFLSQLSFSRHQYFTMGVGPRDDQASLASIGKDLGKIDAIETYNGNKYTNIGLSDEDAEFFDTFPEDRKRKMIRKIDFRLVPVLALLYLAGTYGRFPTKSTTSILI
jgi:hypothetical protein